METKKFECDICSKEFTDEVPNWRYGDAMVEGPFHIQSLMYVQGLDKSIETDITEINLCSLPCFCKYGIKIAVVNHDSLGFNFNDFGDFMGNRSSIIQGPGLT